MKKRYISAVLFLLFVSNCAYAIDDEEYFIVPENGNYKIFGQAKKHTINTLDNYIESLENSSISIDKFTREDIERQNNPSLKDIIQQSTGVIVNTNNGSDGNISNIRIRGTDRVRMTIDGIRADRTTGIGL